MQECILKEYAKKNWKFTEGFLSFCWFCTSFWLHFPYLSHQIGPITAYFSHCLCSRACNTYSRDTKIWQKEERSIRKKIKISSKRSCVNVIFLTSPPPLYYLLLLTASFWTEFSEHVFTLNLASIALNMHMVFFSLERSMQQRF